MKYVSSKFTTYLCILGLATATLTGCDDPAVEVGTLGKKLSAPALKSTSPFDQNFDSQKYVHISGSCDNRVGDLSVSFKLSTSSATTGSTSPTAAQIASAAQWHTPPSSPDVTGTSLTGPITNDVNCADGVFDFYLTKNDLYALWGFDGSSNNNDVDAIYLKGATLIGDTQILSLIDPKTGGNNVASKIVIEKQWPRGFAGSGHCESFNVFLTDGNGNGASASTPVTFNLSQAVGGTSANTFAYTSWDLCNAAYTTGATAGVNSFTIPAGQNNIQLMVPMPTDASYFDKVFSFSVTSTGLITGNPSSVTLRDSSSTIHRWLAMDPNGGNRFHKDICYPIQFNRHIYSGGYDTSATALNISLSSTNSKLNFYSDTGCATSTSSFSITANSSSVTGYVRYNSDATDTSDVRIPVTLTSADSSYDLAPFTAEIDVQGASVASQIDLWGPKEIDRANCTAFMAVAQNNHYAQIPASSDIQVNLTSTATGVFYSSSDCSGSIASSVTISSGKTSSYVYFRGTPSTTAGTFSMTVSASGYTSTTRDLVIDQPNASDFNLTITATATKNTCIPMTLSPKDAIGVIPATGNITFAYSFSGTYASASHFYTDSACTTAAGSSSNVLSPSNNSYTVYLKSSTVETITNGTFSVTFNNGTSVSNSLSITWAQ